MKVGDVYIDRKNKKPPLKCMEDLGDCYILAPCNATPIRNWETMEVSGTVYTLNTTACVRVRVNRDQESEFLQMVELAK